MTSVQMAVEVNIVMGRSRSNNGEFEIELRCGFVVFFFGIINKKPNTKKEKKQDRSEKKAVTQQNAIRRENSHPSRNRVCANRNNPVSCF